VAAAASIRSIASTVDTEDDRVDDARRLVGVSQ
jgi:hypothetical protein